MKTWRERVIEAQQRKSFTVEDQQLASRWETCAVGEQHAQHPLVVKMRPNPVTGQMQPEDNELIRLGSGIRGEGFNDAVIYRAYRRAEVLLDAIEDRVLQLKREAQ